MTEGVDYYLDGGKWVFTERFLRNRNFCCGSGCRHCPYGFKKPMVKEYIIEPGEYIWRSSTSDVPVTVIGCIGKGPDGRFYAKIADSETAVPADELIKVNNAPPRSRKPPGTKLF